MSRDSLQIKKTLIILLLPLFVSDFILAESAAIPSTVQAQSVPGEEWEEQDSGTGESLHDVTWSGNKFVTVGDYGTILTSPTGEAPDPGSNASLSALEVDPGELDPNFDPETREYSFEVAHNVESINVTATLSYPKATMTINEDPAASGEAKEISLNAPGTATEISIEVTAEDGIKQKTYTIAVNRTEATEQRLYASFIDAVYAYDGNQWLPAPVAHAPASALGVHDGQLYGSFTDATYYYNGHTWTVFSYPTQALAVY